MPFRNLSREDHVSLICLYVCAMILIYGFTTIGLYIWVESWWKAALGTALIAVVIKKVFPNTLGIFI